MKKLTFLSILLLSSTFVFAERFHPGSITYANGETKEGQVIIPRKYAEKTIRFRTDGDAPTEKIKSSDLKRVSIVSDDGNKHAFEFLPIVDNPWKGKAKKPGWIQVISEGGYATLYLLSEKYSTDKEGNVSTTTSYVAGRSLPSFNYYIRKGEENKACLLAITSPSPTMLGLTKQFRKLAEIVLPETPELVERIGTGKGEFTHKDVPQFVEMYNAAMKSKK
jgi:hypothetical protein